MSEKIKEAFEKANKDSIVQQVLSNLAEKDVELVKLYGSLMFSRGGSCGVDEFMKGLIKRGLLNGGELND